MLRKNKTYRNNFNQNDPPLSTPSIKSAASIEMIRMVINDAIDCLEVFMTNNLLLNQLIHRLPWTRRRSHSLQAQLPGISPLRNIASNEIVVHRGSIFCKNAGS